MIPFGVINHKPLVFICGINYYDAQFWRQISLPSAILDFYDVIATQEINMAAISYVGAWLEH